MGTKLKYDIKGQRFGKAVALEYVGNRKWKCQCDCGNLFETRTERLLHGVTKSCGCFRRSGEPYKRHGATKTRLYHIWMGLRVRCNQVGGKDYKNYGGRGIKVCSEWNDSYETFAEWAKNNGYADNLSIDRIDNDGDYCPENCRWATTKQQANNRRTNRYLTFRGQTKTLREWSEITGISLSGINYRFRKGWSVDKTLSTPGRKSKGA